MPKPIFHIPVRKYCDGDKEMFTARLPQNLVDELKRIADQKGWSLTDLVMTALDQYAQHEAKQRKRG